MTWELTRHNCLRKVVTCSMVLLNLPRHSILFSREGIKDISADPHEWSRPTCVGFL